MLAKKEFNTVIQKNISLKYLLYLPKDYEADTTAKDFPLVIFLHGMGERGNDLEKVKVHGIPKEIEAGKDFDFICACPQCPDGERFWGYSTEDEFLCLLKELINNYRVDTSRIYLTGLSMGGFGTWYYGAKFNRAFAALAPICGGTNLPEEEFINYKDTPIWNFHGAKDPTVDISQSTRIINILNELDINEVKFTVYPELEHDSWTETYENPALYKWLLGKTNNNFAL